MTLPTGVVLMEVVDKGEGFDLTGRRITLAADCPLFVDGLGITRPGWEKALAAGECCLHTDSFSELWEIVHSGQGVPDGCSTD